MANDSNQNPPPPPPFNQPPYNQPPYGQPPYGQPPFAQIRPHRGVMVLVFGILGLLCCFLFGIAAWVMGSNDLREMQAGRMDSTGQSMTRVGEILGIISVVLWILGVVFAAFSGFSGLGGHHAPRTVTF